MFRLATVTTRRAVISRAAISSSTVRLPVTGGGIRLMTTANGKVGSGHDDFLPHDKKTGKSTAGAATTTNDGTTESKADIETSEKVQEWLAKVVKEHPALLFMKGTPDAPQCGFSRRVVKILQDNNASFASADVLGSPEVREGVKVFSKWPTLPQLYIGGEFVGGCDIVTALDESKELKEMLMKAGAIKI